MDRMFPFGFESHLSFYLVVYVLTLVVHVFLMAYVLAGSLWLSWVTLFPGSDSIPRTKQPLARILRDWMPFALSGAITAGVAPLLFVQILYRQQFYSANLLLGWRWMVVIPVLVSAFYLLYIVKSKVVSRMSLLVRLGHRLVIGVRPAPEHDRVQENIGVALPINAGISIVKQRLFFASGAELGRHLGQKSGRFH